MNKNPLMDDQAFPGIGRQFDNDSQEHVYCSNGGMTLRDYFAAKAMQSLIMLYPLSTDPQSRSEQHKWMPEATICIRAYFIADAMLVARNEV